jgi:hypothetical protein
LAEKKDAKQGKKSGSASAKAYTAGFRRYFNMVRKVTRHVARNPRDFAAAAWLKAMRATLAIDYVRGSPKIRAAHDGIFLPREA